MKNTLVIVRSGGDMATGTIQALYRAGFPVLVLETEAPSAIRRRVALSEAVYDGTAVVEDMTARLCRNGRDIETAWFSREIPIVVDPEARFVSKLQPWAVVDAILAKRNIGTSRLMARHTVALGPGFMAGEDVDAVIETMRGHDLGRIIFDGPAMADTGVPGVIGGYGKERVIHSPAKGRFYGFVSIGDVIEKGEPLGIVTENGIPDGGTCQDISGVIVPAALTGLVRGIIRDAYPVPAGYKIADIDPRREEYANCFTISDKARSIGGSVVTALLWLEEKKRRTEKA